MKVGKNRWIGYTSFKQKYTELCIAINNSYCLLGALEKKVTVLCCFAQAKVDIYQQQSSCYLASPDQVKCMSWYTINIQSCTSFLNLQKWFLHVILYTSVGVYASNAIWKLKYFQQSKSCNVLHVVYMLATFQGMHSNV